jgi:ribosomal protein S18 acetylase RimI-like enzyme
MSDRAARMIVLCEDLQHATFIRRLLKALGFPKGRIRVNRFPDGGGAADQYV